MRLLDLFCGAGGAAMGYHRAGFEVIGVDIRPQRHYPFEFHQADALTFDLSGFSVIHASPPCQTFSAYGRRTGVGHRHQDLVAQTRDLLQSADVVYVIENVVGAPLIGPVQLCGSSFGLDVRRHRLFESNVTLEGTSCNHAWQTPRFPPAANRTNLRSTVEVGAGRVPMAVQSAAMGIDWMSRRELSEAIPPAFTEFIGHQLA